MMSALRRPLLLLSALALPCLMDSCSSSTKIRGLPKNLPVINLYGSAATPSHSMDKKDYPFDANGNYVSSWASLGGAPASGSDYDSWRSSHGGSASKRKSSPVRKVSSKKSTASSKSKGKGGSSGYTIKAGDTLSAIARRNNTTVAKIKAANGMTSDSIRAGKALKIPK